MLTGTSALFGLLGLSVTAQSFQESANTRVWLLFLRWVGLVQAILDAGLDYQIGLDVFGSYNAVPIRHALILFQILTPLSRARSMLNLAWLPVSVSAQGERSLYDRSPDFISHLQLSTTKQSARAILGSGRAYRLRFAHDSQAG
jgi:hypothetical protein